MTYGEALRAARVSRGWSQNRLVIAIRARWGDPTLTITRETIRDIEEGGVKSPRDTTRVLIAKALPELVSPQNPPLSA